MDNAHPATQFGVMGLWHVKFDSTINIMTPVLSKSTGSIFVTTAFCCVDYVLMY